ncbi:hypothetical protein PPTG_11148 [Phytophthora nicotianae INRA-310]|uniref:Uncharacterized protein n=6 Tax=Phytophthora nicotianae TaxID=4792 RepID=W2Q8A6_PHYN3|nr:hypothetical protein PPTG_11148 [Phytophthora nicotianae INRA-310]ETI46867.1 hypothetical protein F443_08810 [Phytophthora nicotianae P1569]ETL40208.1 hypothetical protein L916_08575 [Phytophthora nicotianae]ETO75574.1 hypothetical protein F444_08879 [Phytophthora nicotianae P1976]ETM46614.1 hypothetical protein L914_08531 [Phytophthora nicotianae]ETN09106.1 hypothetical protein PPTG_11148 [Phytophthora nicotianae INRA-310]
MRGLKKKETSEYASAKAVPISLGVLTVLHAFLDSPTGLKGSSEESRDVSLSRFRPSIVVPDEFIDYGTYALFNHKTTVTEGPTYNLRHVSKDEDAINAYLCLCNWVDYTLEPKGHQWRDGDFVFQH